MGGGGVGGGCISVAQPQCSMGTTHISFAWQSVRCDTATNSSLSLKQHKQPGTSTFCNFMCMISYSKLLWFQKHKLSTLLGAPVRTRQCFLLRVSWWNPYEPCIEIRAPRKRLSLASWSLDISPRGYCTVSFGVPYEWLFSFVCFERYKTKCLCRANSFRTCIVIVQAFWHLGSLLL